MVTAVSFSKFLSRSRFLGDQLNAKRPGAVCWFCAVNPANSIDHFIPQSRGDFARIHTDENGLHNENLIPCCLDCNMVKGSLPIEEWIPMLVERFREPSLFLPGRFFDAFIGLENLDEYWNDRRASKPGDGRSRRRGKQSVPYGSKLHVAKVLPPEPPRVSASLAEMAKKPMRNGRAKSKPTPADWIAWANRGRE